MSGTIELFVRLVISMAVVMAVMAVAARLVRRRQGGSRSGRTGYERTGHGPTAPGATGSGVRARFSSASGRDGPGSGREGPSFGLGGLWGGAKSRRARPIPPFQIVYRRPLAKGAWLTLVETTDKSFLVGVTEQSVTLLTELTADARSIGALEPHDGPPRANASGDSEDWPQAGRMPVSIPSAADEARSDHAWKLALDSLRERTVRR